jgi:enamine deaminase RidA (YjgF/YER057c/UK114 family)
MAPPATFAPVVRVGELAFVSGQGPIVAETGAMVVGKVGGSVSVDDARAAARLAGLNALAVLRRELGTLDRIARVAKLFGTVNAAPGFTRIPEVMDGCSELLVEVFGDAGRHARTSVGVSELPFDLCLELDLVVMLQPVDAA